MSDHYETSCPSCGGSDEQGCYADCPTTVVTEQAARIEALEAENKRLREALAPFAKKFAKLRTEYSRRYVDAETVGLTNFDKMPDEWPMERAIFDMGTFRRAAAAMEKK